MDLTSPRNLALRTLNSSCDKRAKQQSCDEQTDQFQHKNMTPLNRGKRTRIDNSDLKDVDTVIEPSE